MKNNTSLRGKLKEQIKEILLDDQVNIGMEEEEVLGKCAGLLLTKAIGCIDSKDLELEDIDNYYLFQMWDERVSLEQAMKNFEQNLKNKYMAAGTEYNYIRIVFSVENIRQKVLLENKTKLLKEYIKNTINQINSQKQTSNGKVTNKEIEIETIFVSGDSYRFQIGIESRIKSLETSREIKTDSEEKVIISGYVFIADLAGIVEVYNKLGNDLFNYNIRYGIKDELDVDLEIKKTLENAPDEFWYLNNGITMLIQDDEFAIKKTNCLEVNSGRNKMISVINGAQTITASAGFFYNEVENKKANLDKNIAQDKMTEGIAKVKLASDKAKVILRIIHINNVRMPESQEICAKEIDKISLSLNRQKPIQPEDVAFTSRFISKINELKDKKTNDQSVFTIIRRGHRPKNNEYILVDFARATKAYLAQCPGHARSDGKKDLLEIKVQENSYGFSDGSIFRNELVDEQNNIIGIFKKYYKPVNFAMKLQECYTNQSRTIKKQLSDSKSIAILNYGKWHYVAYIIYVLNDENNEDFTCFDVSPKIEIDIINKSIKEFINLFSQSISSRIDKLDSNQFKNEELYDEFKSYKDKYPNNELSSYIKNFNDFIKASFSVRDFNPVDNQQIAATLYTD
jgi:hypothetical protein